jgi:hypothetical protein
VGEVIEEDAFTHRESNEEKLKKTKKGTKSKELNWFEKNNKQVN